jgi:hypothetical protein
VNISNMRHEMDWRENQPKEKTVIPLRAGTASESIAQLKTIADTLDALETDAHKLGRRCVSLSTDLRHIMADLQLALSNPTDPGDPIRQAIQEKAAAGETR